MGLLERLKELNGGDWSLTKTGQPGRRPADPRDKALSKRDLRTVQNLDRQAARFELRAARVSAPRGNLVFKGGRRAAKAVGNAQALREQAERIRSQASKH